jgi:glc operon protein GlcG
MHFHLRSRRRPDRPIREDSMKLHVLTAIALTTGLFAAGPACAQQPPGPPDLSIVPETMPFNIPFGAPITAERAQALIQVAVAEATKHNWPLDIAVVDPHGDLVAFTRMDGAQLASISISQHKARVAARFRRETVIFENAMVKQGINTFATLDDVIASRGGIPLVEGGKLIGAIGCSGATGSQDEAVCKAAASTINK